MGNFQHKETRQPKDWKGRLMDILRGFLSKSFTKKQKYKVSNATYQKRREVIFLCFKGSPQETDYKTR